MKIIVINLKNSIPLEIPYSENNIQKIKKANYTINELVELDGFENEVAFVTTELSCYKIINRDENKYCANALKTEAGINSLINSKNRERISNRGTLLQIQIEGGKNYDM